MLLFIHLTVLGLSGGTWEVFFFNLKNSFIFTWRIVALQCCAGFCRTSTLLRHVRPLALEPPSRLPPHPPPLVVRELTLSSLSLVAHLRWLSDCRHGNAYVLMLLSRFVPTRGVSDLCCSMWDLLAAARELLVATCGV